MSMVWMTVGATAPDGAVFSAKVDGGGPVRVAVADNAAMSDPVFTSSESVDAQGVAKVSIAGLAASTEYWWQVEDNGVLDTGTTGRFRTHPALGSQASYTIVVGACAGQSPEFPGVAGGELDADAVSNAPTFDTIREHDPLMFAMIGDWGYPDWSTNLTDTLANRRTFWDDLLAQPRQAQLLREIAWTEVYDDHDFADNNSDGTYADKANAAAVYRERMPHFTLPDTDALYHSFTIGRVLFIVSDTRYYRSPNSDPDGPSKTMLGSAQKTWMDGVLAASDAELLVWLCPTPWIGPDTDAWAGFAAERDELVDMFDTNGWADRMVMVYGDRHALGIDSGASNEWGGFPLLQAASIDSVPPSSPATGRFDVLDDTPGRDQYGTVAVTDFGSVITLKLTGWRGDTEVGSLQLAFSTSTPPPSFAGEISDVITGSHRATLEARVLTRFQTGDDPDGTEIAIVSGDVTYDATAEVFATLELTTDGMDSRRRSRFPRVASDLLAPYGHEVFVRRGVDVGSEIVWVPLGYFRLDDDEQQPASDGLIRLSGQDRMAGIVDGKLVNPRQFDATRTVGSAVRELVTDIYPSAVVVFDDNSDSDPLGRQIIVERDRYGALLDIAESIGKVMYWDGQGFLRVETAPDPDDLVWDIKAGHHGVLVDVRRRVSREGMANGVVGIGQGVTDTPVQAIVVDAGPNSPTRWFPPDDPDELWFGQVPDFHTSPLITSNAQARDAATAKLRRLIGLPYQVDFGAVVNPTVRPRQAVRVTQKDGTRERHILDTVTIPLTSGAHMTGTTREQTEIQVATTFIGTVVISDPEE